MVTHWGMSKKVGYMFYGEQEGYFGLTSQFSDQEVNQIDAEIRKILKESHDRTFALLTQHKDQLILLADTLLTYETLSGTEITELLQTGQVSRVIEPLPNPDSDDKTKTENNDDSGHEDQDLSTDFVEQNPPVSGTEITTSLTQCWSSWLKRRRVFGVHYKLS